MINRNVQRTGASAPEPYDAPPAAAEAPLSIAIVSDDPATAQAIARACEAMPSFECRLRFGALRGEPTDMRELPGEVVIFDAANASDRRFDPLAFPTAPCVMAVHDSTAPAVDPDLEQRVIVFLHVGDLSPSAIEMAIRSACRLNRLLREARDATADIAREAETQRDARQRFLDEAAPIARALDGLLEMICADEASAGVDLARLPLLRNWTRDLVAAVDRQQCAIARASGARTDVGAAVARIVSSLERPCAERGQTIILSSPPEPIMVATAEPSLRDALRQLIESACAREPRDRRLDVVLWRSLDECRLAFVAGPAARRFGADEETDAKAAVHEADRSDQHFMGALAALREIGGVVETSSSAAFGPAVVISLPAA
ncbi:MAG: hypothetical protein H6871_06355 [Methylobacteriaceae bacterium]|nr:hypothetical protein [Methylobacteriaceae bacterium]